MKRTMKSMILALIFISTLSCNAFAEKSKEKKETFNLDAKLQKIIKLASLAPSSHNAQMWKLKIINNNELLVILDSQRTLKSVDSKNREALISLGAFIENFVEASKTYNYETEVQIFDEFQKDNSIVKLTLKNKEFINTELQISNIEKRHSIKTAFKKLAIKPEDFLALTSINNQNIKYFDLSSEKGQYLSTSLYDSNVKQAWDKEKQEELAQWIRVSEKESNNKKDGIRAEMMGITGFKKPFYYLFVNKNSTKTKSFINAGLKKVKEQVENCSGYVIISTKSDETADLINCGRLLEKVLLKATELKVAVHPMSQVLEEDPWKSEISKKLDTKENIQMVLRIGYVDDYGNPTSLRRDISEIIIN